MAQFASVEELNTYLGQTLDTNRATLLLRLASAGIQNYTGRTLELTIDDEAELYPLAPAYNASRWQLRLPQRPVLEVTAMTVDEVDSDDFTVGRSGLVAWGTGLPLSESSKVLVTYTHGYAVTPDQIPDPNPLGITRLPDDIVGICLEMAATGLQNPGAVQSEAIGTYRVDYGDVRGEITPNESQQKRLHRYRNF